MSPRRTQTNHFETYSRNVAESVKPFHCRHCGTVVLAKEYEKHCLRHHDLDSRLCCVWCAGRTDWTWKSKNGRHLLSCFNRFIHSVRPGYVPEIPDAYFPPAEPGPVPFDSTPMAPKLDLFDHAFKPPRRAFDHVWPMPLDPNLLTFEDDSLDRAVSCVRKYLELGNEAEWFHVKVQVRAFDRFLEALDADEGRTRTLTFSCWCDGDHPDNSKHRHFVVVSSPPGHFVRDVLGDDFRNLKYVLVRSAMDLVDTIGSLCERVSRCNFFAINEKHLPARKNHFYLFENLPRDYKLPLVLQWDGGLLELLQDSFEDLKPVDLLQAVLSFFERKWRFKIKHLPGVDLNTVLPVARDLRPCRHATPTFLYLTRGRKLYFERDPNLLGLDREEWLKQQADGGNIFYYLLLGPQQWTPPPHDINAIRRGRSKGRWRVKRQPETKTVCRKRKHAVAKLEFENELLRTELDQVKNELADAKKRRIFEEI